MASILGYIFLRPFISGITFKNFDFILTGIFLFSAFLYILKKPFKKTYFDKIIIIFILSLLISTAFSHNILNSINQLYKYLSLIILFYIVKLTDKKNKRRLILILIISTICVSFLSLHSLFVISSNILESFSPPGFADHAFICGQIISVAIVEGNPSSIQLSTEHFLNRVLFEKEEITEDLFIKGPKINKGANISEILSRKRASFPFISPNLFANYLVIIIMFCLGLIIHKIKKDRKDFLFFLSLFCLSLSFLTLFFTKSIGGWVTLSISTFIFFVLGKMLNKKALFVILVILILFSALLYMRIQENRDLTQPLFSIYKRISYWKEVTSIIHQHPITGIGIGNFTLRETRAAHNSYLQIWAEMGLLGIISWLTIIFFFVKKSIEKFHSKEKPYFDLGILLGGVAFLFHNLIDLSFFIPQVAFLWWVILGIIYQEHQTDRNPSLNGRELT